MSSLKSENIIRSGSIESSEVVMIASKITAQLTRPKHRQKRTEYYQKLVSLLITPREMEKKPHWRDQASCRGLDIHLFFPTRMSSMNNDMKERCLGCPVISYCLSSAMYGQDDGLWANTNPTQRAAMRKHLPNPYDTVLIFRHHFSNNNNNDNLSSDENKSENNA